MAVAWRDLTIIILMLYRLKATAVGFANYTILFSNSSLLFPLDEYYTIRQTREMTGTTSNLRVYADDR